MLLPINIVLCVLASHYSADAFNDADLASIPNLTGAKLIGIFEDEHKPLHNATKPKKSSSSISDWLHGINTKKLHFCEETIFEDDSVRIVPTSRPSCMLGSDHTDALNTRHKRDTKMTTLPKLITIPASKTQEVVSEESYIKVRMRVCSMPGGQVLVFDQVTRKVLSGFRNGGTGYHCNQWIEINANDKNKGYERFISDSNQIQIEYKLPVADDYVVSDAKSLFLKPDEQHRWRRQGERSISFKAHESDETAIFQLEIFYEEIPFIYEEPGKFDGPEVVPPGLAGVGQEYGPIKYQPNWIKTIILDRRSLCDAFEENNCQDKFFVGINVEIQHLDLDFDRGDYLLIGPGDRPEFWKNSKGQMIAQKIDEKNSQDHRIWINTDSAFVRLVTHNSLYDDKRASPALKFKWTPGNTTMSDTELGQVSQLLKEASIQLCFTGYECSYYKTVERAFVDESVHIFNRYLIDHEKSITTLINADSVQIFDMEPIFYNKGHFTEQFCQFNLAMASPYDSEYPLVQSDVLYKMFFGNDNSRQMIHSLVTVNNCVFQRISWLTVLIPIAVILIVSLFVILFFWRMQNKMLRKSKVGKIQNKEQQVPLQREPDETAMHY